MTTSIGAFTDLVLEVFRVNGRLLAAGDRIAAPVGLTSARWQVLGAIDPEPLPVARIARSMGLTRQSVQRTVDVLSGEGVVDFAPNPGHKRARLVRLTAAGRTQLDRINAIQKEWARQTVEGLPASDILDALDLLRAIRQRLEQAEGNASGPEDGDER